MQGAVRASVQRSCVSCTFRAAARTLSASTAASQQWKRNQRRNRAKVYSFAYDRLAGEREHEIEPRDSQVSTGRVFRELPTKARRRKLDNGDFASESSNSRARSELHPDLPTYRHVTSPGAVLGGKVRRVSGGTQWQSKLKEGLDLLKKELYQDPVFAKLDLDDLEEQYVKYENHVLNGAWPRDSESEIKHLRKASDSHNKSVLKSALKRGMYRMTAMSAFSEDDIAEQHRAVADLAYPTEWFPATRAMQREFHLHVGPTNSGKTYHALKRLEEAKTGLYAGPLRLLAHEVYERLNSRGLRCNLITGDDRRTADDNPDAPMLSCTVEMVPLNSKLDVAVIDEIQMLSSESRGWAWTQAVLGVQAREMHVCGEERAVPIMQELAALCGEKLHIHRYERLSPLKMMSKSLDGNIRNLRNGDCVVCFSVQTIHALRQLIEKTLQVKVAVIYGSLPPETRAQQANLFNDPKSDYQILVASDAVGMGLNLSIKRMIFHASVKKLGSRFVLLGNHEIKQIAGRAGRFSTARQDIENAVSRAGLNDDQHPVASPIPSRKQTGLVSALDKFDFPNIAEGMAAENDPISAASIFPPASVIDRLAKLLPPGTPFSFIFLRLYEIARTTSRFRLCDPYPIAEIADIIEPVEGLTITHKQILCSSPADPRKEGEPKLIRSYAWKVAERKPCTIMDIPELDLDLLEDDYAITRQYLKQIEALHKGIVLFLWLSYRFDSIFIERELAISVKRLVEKRIEDTLAQMSFDYDYMRRSRGLAIEGLLDDEGSFAFEESSRAHEATPEESEDPLEASDALLEQSENAIEEWSRQDTLIDQTTSLERRM